MNKATVGHSAKYQYLAVLIGMLGARLFVKNRMIEKKSLSNHIPTSSWYRETYLQ